MAKLFDLSDAGKLTKHINIDEEAWQFLPSKWAETEPERKRILIRNMLTMTSGLTPYDGPYEADYEEKVFAQTVESLPGTVWAYASVPVDMLSLVIENITGQKMGDFFNEYIDNPIGVASVEWGKFGNYTGGSGGPGGGTKFPARELARIGYLVLHDGIWEKEGRREQVISEMRIEKFTQKASWLENTKWRQPNFAFEPQANRYYGHLWWNNSTGQALGETAPRDAVYMSGWGKQACFVVPSLDMMVVRLGPNRTLNNYPEFYHGLWKRLMEAVIDREK
jgi:CubicO group peptidase (beta-lactamase class C family)